jgi:hypothetical protein
MDKVGPEAVVKLTHKLGVKSEIPIQPSIALGSRYYSRGYGCGVRHICKSRCLYKTAVFIEKTKVASLSMNQYLNHMMC